MFPRPFLLFILIPAALLTPQTSPSQQTGELRAQLERVYHDWRGAVINRDVRAWQRSTSRYRQVHTHNMIVSQRGRYPEAVFDVPLRPPEITTLRLLEAEAVGDTAHLVYFGKVDLGIEAESIPENLLLLRYIREPEGWKFDTSRLINLEGVPDVRASLRQGGDPDFLEKPEFTPPGKAPPVPPVCKVPDYVAAFHVQAFGYEVAVKINGFDYPPVKDIAVNQLIIGGLDRDKNDLSMNIAATELPEGEERLLEINVLVVTQDPKNPVNVYRYRTTDPNPEATRRDAIWVNNSTLKR